MSLPWVLRHPTLRALTALSALWALSFGLTIPFLTVTARDRGVSVDAIGLIAASYLLAQIFLQAPFGALSDRIGRAGLLAAGIAVFSVATASFVFADSMPEFMLLRAMQGLGFAMGLPSYRAMVADVTAPNERGRAYAAMGTAYSSGLLLGPALGGFLVGLVGRDALFLLTAAIEAGLAVGVILLLRGKSRPAVPNGGERVPLSALLTRPLLGAFLLAFVGHFPMGFIESIWALYVLDRGGSELVVGISFSAIAISKLVLQPFGGRLADRGNQPRLLLAGFLAMALAIIAYGLMPWAAGIIVIGFIEGAAAALAYPALDAYVASKADPRIQGRVQGTFSSLMMAGATVSAVGGALLYGVAPGLPFVVGGIAMGMLTCVAFVLIRGAMPGYPVQPAGWPEMSEGLQP